MPQILECQKIKIDLSCNSTSYIINHDKAYIDLFSNQDDNSFDFHPLKLELEFLKILLIEFIKKNKDYCGYDQIILHNGGYNNVMELDNRLMPHILQAQSIIYYMKE